MSWVGKWHNMLENQPPETHLSLNSDLHFIIHRVRHHVRMLLLKSFHVGKATLNILPAQRSSEVTEDTLKNLTFIHNIMSLELCYKKNGDKTLLKLHNLYTYSGKLEKGSLKRCVSIRQWGQNWNFDNTVWIYIFVSSILNDISKLLEC